MQNNSIFDDLREKFAILQKKKQAAQPGHISAMLQEQQTGEKNAAAAWLVFFVSSVVLTLFVGWMGYNYYLQVFGETFPSTAGIMSVSLVAMIEVVKVFLAYSAISALLFGWMFKSYSKFLYWLMGWILAGGVYLWSYNISTEGMHQFITNEGNETKQASTLSRHLDQATAQIDAQIADIQTGNKEASAMKNKRGKVVYTGQTILQSNAETLRALQIQRGEIITAATKEFGDTQNEQTAKTSGFASFIEKFGGYAEFAIIIMLLGMVLNDKSRGEDAKAAYPTPQQKPSVNGVNGSTQGPTQNGYRTNPIVQNTTNTANPIGYGIYSPTQSPQPPVSQCDTGVTQVNDGSEGAFKNHRTDFLRDLANLANNNGNRGTICGRIGTSLQGMIDSSQYCTQATAQATLSHIQRMYDIRDTIANEYTVPVEQTPLRDVGPKLDALNEIIKAKCGVVAA